MPAPIAAPSNPTSVPTASELRTPFLEPAAAPKPNPIAAPIRAWPGLNCGLQVSGKAAPLIGGPCCPMGPIRRGICASSVVAAAVEAAGGTDVPGQLSSV